MSEIFLASLLKYFHFLLEDCTHRTFPNSGSFGMFRKVRETCPKGFGLKLANLGLKTPLKSQAEPS